MFRVLVIVAIAALPVIALGLLIGPLPAAILLLAELGYAVYWVIRRLVSDPSEADGNG